MVLSLKGASKGGKSDVGLIGCIGTSPPIKGKES